MRLVSGKNKHQDAAELNRHQSMWRSCREVTEDGRGSGGNGDKTKRREEVYGQRAAGRRNWKSQQLEAKVEAGQQRQETAEGLEEATERAGRKHQPQHSESQGGGQGCR